ncbi:MAG TPA: hypothetical protein VGH48_10575 [Caldimonas sp.]
MTLILRQEAPRTLLPPPRGFALWQLGFRPFHRLLAAGSGGARGPGTLHRADPFGRASAIASPAFALAAAASLAVPFWA